MNHLGSRTLLLAAVFALSAHAQSVDPADLGQRLRSCEATSERARRAACFEALARDAVGEVTRTAQRPRVGETRVAPQAGSPDATYRSFATSAKAKLTKDFLDPSSVQWRSTFVSNNLGLTLCGEVNAKNTYGAYVGFRRFYVNNSVDLFTAIDGAENRRFSDATWDTICVDKAITID